LPSEGSPLPATRLRENVSSVIIVGHELSDVSAEEYRQAEEIRDAFARHGVRYLFIGTP